MNYIKFEAIFMIIILALFGIAFAITFAGISYWYLSLPIVAVAVLGIIGILYDTL